MSKIDQNYEFHDLYANKNTSSTIDPNPIIIFDVMSLNCLLLEKFTQDLVFGGRHWICTQYLDRLFSELVDLGVKLVFFVDGFVQNDKYECWSKRQSERYKKHIRLLDSIYASEITPTEIAAKYKDSLYNNSLLNLIEFSCKKFGHLVYAVSFECDREIACYANEVKAFAVFSNDTDFLIFPGLWRYFSTKDIDVDKFTTKAYSRRAFRRHFNLSSSNLAIFASLVGNDFVPCAVLAEFHARISNGETNPMKLLQKIADLIRNICTQVKFDDFMMAAKFFSQHAFGAIDTRKEMMIARSLVFYMADERREMMLREPEYGIFTHNVLQGNTVNFTLILFDLRRDDLGSYYDVSIPMFQRQAGAIQKLYSVEPRQVTFCGKETHARSYMRFNVDPIEPFFELPSMKEIQSFDPALNGVRHNLLKWLIDWKKFEHFNIASLPANYIIDIVTIIFMRQHQIITWKESDLLIWTVKNVNRNTISTKIKHPDTIDSRAFRIAFLYSRMYANIARSFEICGLSEVYGVSIELLLRLNYVLRL